jgi:hypothetical protein
MDETATIFIGADNDTGEIDIPRIETIIGKRHDGATVWPADGYWKGNHEASAVAVISDTAESVMATINDLKSELSQDAIAYELGPALHLA